MENPKLQTYVGAVYFTNLNGFVPMAIIMIDDTDFDKPDWLVEMLVGLFPGQENFGWNGCHVMLTTRKTFNLQTYSPNNQSVFDLDFIEFTNEEIHEEFRDNPRWKHLESFECV
jgi:hypothetical protein